MPGISVPMHPGNQKFFEEQIEKENKLRRLRGLGPSPEDIQKLIDNKNPQKLPPIDTLPPLTPPRPDGTPDLMPQVEKLKKMDHLKVFFPKLKGRDAHSLTQFLFSSPVEVTAYGQARIPNQIVRANTVKPIKYTSQSQRNFSMGQNPTWTNKHKMEEAMEYLDAFNSKICASETDHRTTYGEFSKFVHKNGRSYFIGGLR